MTEDVNVSTEQPGQDESNWGPAAAALTAALVLVAVLILIAARQV